MERKEFLMASGMLITAAVITSTGCVAEKENNSDIKNRRPDPNQFDDPIMKAIAFGLNAPNPHNTQAWKFKIINPTEAFFFVDETRILSATDPITRQIHIGCGSFIALFQIGASTFGYSTTVAYLPDGEYSISEIGKKPIAKLTLEKGTIEAEALSKHIFLRQTNRSTYQGNLLKKDEFNKILSLSKPAYADVELINDPKELKPALELLYKGMEIECYDWITFDESRKWFRVNQDILLKRDGLNLGVSGVGGISRWFAEILLKDYSKKVWHSENSIQGLLDGHYKNTMSARGLVTFSTTSNTLLDWIKCGQDYARFQLAAYDQGFYLHPLSQVLQEYPSMKTLYGEFNQMMNVIEPAKIQMAVRIGRSKPLEYSYRRNPADLIIHS